MTLSEFVGYIRRVDPLAAEDLAAFVSWWETSRVELPCDYPEEMAERDWREQYLAWLSVQEGEGDD